MATVPTESFTSTLLSQVKDGHYVLGSIVNQFKYDTPCRYYNSTRGCKYGTKCRFQHISFQSTTTILFKHFIQEVYNHFAFLRNELSHINQNITKMQSGCQTPNKSKHKKKKKRRNYLKKKYKKFKIKNELSHNIYTSDSVINSAPVNILQGQNTKENEIDNKQDINTNGITPLIKPESINILKSNIPKIVSLETKSNGNQLISNNTNDTKPQTQDTNEFIYDIYNIISCDETNDLSQQTANKRNETKLDNNNQWSIYMKEILDLYYKNESNPDKNSDENIILNESDSSLKPSYATTINIREIKCKHNKNGLPCTCETFVQQYQNIIFHGLSFDPWCQRVAEKMNFFDNTDINSDTNDELTITDEISITDETESDDDDELSDCD